MRKLSFITASISVVVLALALGTWTGAVYHSRIAGAFMDRSASSQAADVAVSAAAAPANAKKERKILYWQDAMYNPPYISNKPGKSPMGMDLTPVYEDEVASGTTVTVDPVIVQNMGVRTAGVERVPLYATIRAVGTFVEPEQSRIDISLRVDGWIQKLYANQDGMAVQKGDILFDLYSPGLTAAADELISAHKAAGVLADDPATKSSVVAILSAARRKLELLGVSDDEIDAIAKLDAAPKTIAFRSPITGEITEKHVIDGSAVKAGDSLLRISDRSTMWLQVQVFEHDLSLIQVGMPVTATVTAFPGETLRGKVDFVYPHLDAATRTATVRVVFPNHDHRIHENMYAKATIQSEMADAFSVPREAIIDSGTRQIVFLSDGNGHFSPRQVTVGMTGTDNDSAGERVQVLAGLTGDETVVTSGQFLLDSESRLQEAIQKQLEVGAPIANAPAAPTAGQVAAPAPKIDGIVSAYLALTAHLTGPDAVPADPQPLVSAASTLTAAQTAGSLHDQSATIQAAAEKLGGHDIAAQREALKPISAAIIHLLDQESPSTAVASALYQFNCPMTHADWVQEREEPANPYLPDMPTCATLTRKIPAQPAAPAQQEHRP